MLAVRRLHEKENNDLRAANCVGSLAGDTIGGGNEQLDRIRSGRKRSCGVKLLSLTFDRTILAENQVMRRKGAALLGLEMVGHCYRTVHVDAAGEYDWLDGTDAAGHADGRGRIDDYLVTNGCGTGATGTEPMLPVVFVTDWRRPSSSR